MNLQTEDEVKSKNKTAKLIRIGTKFIIQFVDALDQERSATAFCDDLATAQKTFKLVTEREFTPKRIPVRMA